MLMKKVNAITHGLFWGKHKAGRSRPAPVEDAPSVPTQLKHLLRQTSADAASAHAWNLPQPPPPPPPPQDGARRRRGDALDLAQLKQWRASWPGQRSRQADKPTSRRATDAAHRQEAAHRHEAALRSTRARHGAAHAPLAHEPLADHGPLASRAPELRSRRPPAKALVRAAIWTEAPDEVQSFGAFLQAVRSTQRRRSDWRAHGDADMYAFELDCGSPDNGNDFCFYH
ncbi:hypothetical protein M885DRAFT_590176 [Pelagophyceae sp. CCMP2097]|nr:hypothetical protein M885DRAFT_590176 [Pelagophyceae sp. CCMP2097]